MTRSNDTTIRRPTFSRWHLALLAIATVAGMTGFSTSSHAQDGNACTKSATWAFIGCRNEMLDDYFVGRAICANESDEEDESDCLADVKEARLEDQALCAEQRAVRNDLCDALGEEPYDPDWQEIGFVADPRDLNTYVSNPYWPMVVGRTLVYQGDGERVTVTVEDALKFIDGVYCIVFNDVVEEIDEDELADDSDENDFLALEGQAIENTDDWYAQDLDGNVWYCGEIAVDSETFDEDVNEGPEIISIDGSFKHNRDGAKAGFQMLANPTIGAVYRQENSIGEAEDAAEVVATGVREMREEDVCENDLIVDPADIVEERCAAGDGCIINREFQALEPDALAYKYVAWDIGTILEVEIGVDDEGDEESSCVVLVDLQ